MNPKTEVIENRTFENSRLFLCPEHDLDLLQALITSSCGQILLTLFSELS